VAVGDVNRDGYADLVVVDPDSSSGEGNGLVHIFSGKNFRLLGTLEASVFGRFFNDISSVAVGDLNRDGYADIAVGDEDADADTATEDGKNGSFQDFEGAVAVVSGKTLRRVTQIDGSDWGDAGEFGQSIAIGDVTNHGGRELVVVDDRTGEGGAVFIFHLRSSDFHSAGGPRIRLRRVIDVISEVDGEMDDITGVACADLDGDGHADIILGDEDSADNGRVVVLSGKNFRVLARLDQERYDTDDGNEFGSAVSAVGRTKRARAFIVVADEDREITGSKVRHEGRIYLIAASKGNGLLGTIDGEGIDIRGRIRRR
jgi:hypothetical protein